MIKKIISILLVSTFIFSAAALKFTGATATEIPEIDLDSSVIDYLNEDVYSITFDLSDGVATTDDGGQSSIADTLNISAEDASALADTDSLDDLLSENLLGEVKISGDEVTVTNPYALDTLIVETDDESIFDAYEPEDISAVSDNFYIIKLEDAASTKTAYEELSRSDKTANVALDGKVYALDEPSLTPIDPLGTQSASRLAWGVQNTGLNHYTDWLNYLDSDKEVIVAVLDTGINPSHEVFTDSDGESRIYLDGTAKYNYYSSADDAGNRYSSSNYLDDNGHGTACAGLVAESTPKNVKILPLKVLNSAGSGNISDVMSAISDKVNVVDIFNLSFGATLSNYGYDRYSYNEELNTFDRFIESLTSDGDAPFIVAAAGNSRESVVAVPAASEHVVAVSATDSNNAFASVFTGNSGSNYGDALDFTMPGKDLVVPYYTSASGYARGSGTSFSSPFLASAAALLKAEFPDYNASALYSALQKHAVDLGDSGWDKYYGYGLVDFGQTKFSAPLVTASSAISNNKLSATLTFSAFSTTEITAYTLTQSSSTPSSSDWRGISSTPSGSSYTLTNTATVSDNGTYYIWVKDDSANTANAVITISDLSSSVNLPSGFYTIDSALTTSKRLDINGASLRSGANAQLWEANSTLAQQFYIEKQSDGYYTIRNIKSGKYLDANGGVARNGTNVQQWDKNSTLAQRWVIRKDSTTGNFFIVSAINSTYVVDIIGGHTTNGTNIALWEFNGGRNQQFAFTQISSYTNDTSFSGKTYIISSVLNPNMVLDVHGDSISCGGNINLWTKKTTNNRNQQFTFELNDDGATYTIRSVNSGLVLDVAWDSVNLGANVEQCNENGGANQKWVVEKNIFGEISIHSINGGFYLDAYGGVARNGTNIDLWDSHTLANRAQYFKFTEI